MAWSEIAKRFGVTECRVRQIHDVAIEKLRLAMLRDRDGLRLMLEEIELEPKQDKIGF